MTGSTALCVLALDAFQPVLVLSIVPGWCLFGLQTLFVGLSMGHVQQGLNLSWARAQAPAAQPVTGPWAPMT